MARAQKEPLRPRSAAEHSALAQVSGSAAMPAGMVARATALLAVARGARYTAAAQAAGRRSGDAVAQVVARFNREGLAALEPRHGGGPALLYTETERQRILAEARRVPDRERDGTATWSLTTLQRALRQAPAGLPEVSTYTIWCVLRGEGWTWQRSRSWCDTGRAQRLRRGRVVTVTDPDATPKKTSSRPPIQRRRALA
jgi:transposase